MKKSIIFILCLIGIILLCTPIQAAFNHQHSTWNEPYYTTESQWNPSYYADEQVWVPSSTTSSTTQVCQCCNWCVFEGGWQGGCHSGSCVGGNPCPGEYGCSPVTTTTTIPGHYTTQSVYHAGYWSSYQQYHEGYTSYWNHVHDPYGTITSPASTSSAVPTFLGNLRPTITWSQGDYQNGAVYLYYYDIVFRDIHNNIVSQTGQQTQNTSASSNSWTFSSNITAGTPFSAEIRVHDGVGWSGYSSKKWFMYNNLPVTTVTFPTGTSIGTATGAPIPSTITWTYADADNHAQNQYQLEIRRASDNALMTSPPVTTTAVKSYQFTSANGLAQGETYYVQVRTFDSYQWGAWSTPKYFITNRPPVSNFSWSPTIVHEGDNRTFTNTSTDPDPADASTLAYRWQVDHHANAATVCGNPATARADFTSTNLVLNNLLAGTYCISLQTTDQWGAYNTITKKVLVSPLTVDGRIAHTADWETHRATWNTQNAPSNRPVTMYWAGEKFIASADTTLTGTTTKATTVVVEMRNSSNLLISTVSLATTNSPTNTVWAGELWDTSYEALPDGQYTFTFTSTFNNGTVRTDIESINLIGSVRDVINAQAR